jgi:hypothetical protein
MHSCGVKFASPIWIRQARWKETFAPLMLRATHPNLFDVVKGYQ